MFRKRRWDYAHGRPAMLSLLAAILLTGATLSAYATTPVSGEDLAGEPVDPLHVASGKVVVLIFVRTDCPVSNRYAPTIQRLGKEYSGTVTFWLVYPDKRELAPAIEKHLSDYGYKLPALRDPQHGLAKLGQAEVTPEVAVFNAAGQLVYHGRIDNWYQDFGHARKAPTTHELDDAIQATLNGRKPPVSSATGVGCYISDLE